MADQSRTLTFVQVAQAALSIVGTASVPASDEGLAIAGAVRQFLRGVMSGEYVITAAADRQSAGPASASSGVVPAAPAVQGTGIRGSDGVVSEEVTGAPS